ncbi:uncharacterized protein LOC126100963 isoform X1 [Schistocerca cancellata]|uniref:uncharacterized protein LOC126100963 isoform X1 n=1 Tax=Schistocerca cancellata TaxID=274614 RepID=UPI002117B821|nr:uncharacterized protein LOC126100963 isoform X1 [Schistocerca cancellata]
MEAALIDNADVQVRSSRPSFYKRPQLFTKLIELALAVSTVALLSQNLSIADTVLKGEIVHGTIIGFIMINILIIFAELTQPMGKAPLVLSSVFGCLMFTLTGVFLLQESKSASVVTSGIISVVEGILFLGDIFISLCYRRNYIPID